MREKSAGKWENISMSKFMDKKNISNYIVEGAGMKLAHIYEWGKDDK